MKKKFFEEVFGRQEETVKFFGLVDSDFEEEFDVRLDSLKESWMEREAKLGCSLPMTFYEWFKNEKVSNSRKQLKLKNLQKGVINQSNNQSINQSLNQSIRQSANQSTNRSIH